VPQRPSPLTFTADVELLGADDEAFVEGEDVVGEVVGFIEGDAVVEVAAFEDDCDVDGSREEDDDLRTRHLDVTPHLSKEPAE
jgi:hypothetical protein